MKVRQKPIILDAVKWTGENVAELEALTGPGAPPRIVQQHDGRLLVITHEGSRIAKVGDWVLRSSQGALSVCTDEVYTQTYDALEGIAS